MQTELLLRLFFNWYMISIDLLLLIGLIFFIKLPYTKRVEKLYWIPFLIIWLTVVYENFGAFLTYEKTFNEKINLFLGNNINLNYNIWLFNIGNLQICTVLFLWLISLYLPKKNKRLVRIFIWIFIGFSLVSQILGFQPIYDSQPFLFAIGAGFVMISCGLYFISFMNKDVYLGINPLRLFSFWQVIFILFYFSLIFLKTISEKYIYELDKSFAMSLAYINPAMWILIMTIFVLTIIAASMQWEFEIEPIHD